MRPLCGGLMVGLSVALLVAFSPFALAATGSAGDPDGPPQLLTELQMGSAKPMATTTLTVSSELIVPHWTFWAGKGASLGVQPTTAPDGSETAYALEGSYPVPARTGADYVGAVFHVQPEYQNVEDVYIEFWAKMPGIKEGCKFLKIFGYRSPATGYANTTIGTDYTGAEYGALREIGFGDGSTNVNDSQKVINLRGSGTNIGRSAATAVIQTPQESSFSAADWGNGWHHFRVHVKFNSGTTSQNEVPNGEYYLEIDGKVYVDATGVYNRNPVNGPINKIEFFGWAQTESHPFQVWYDDIRISTGGFMSTPLPSPPQDPSVK